jgi:hypothetical protein
MTQVQKRQRSAAKVGNVYRTRLYKARQRGDAPDIDYHDGVEEAIAAAGLGSVPA